VKGEMADKSVGRGSALANVPMTRPDLDGSDAHPADVQAPTVTVCSFALLAGAMSATIALRKVAVFW
jgi:hypothetical protein